MSNDKGASVPLVKGIGFVGIFKFIKIQPEGEMLLKKVLDSLSPEAALVCGKKIITVKDYPYPVFTNLLRTVDRVLGFGDLSLCKDLGEFAADRDYEFFFGPNKGMLKPADLFRDCNVYWRSYYQNAGHMQTIDASPDHSAVRISDFPQMDQSHCRLMEGWMAQSMINAGALWIEYSESSCTSRGDSYHEYIGRWRMREEGEEAVKIPSPRRTLSKTV